MQNPYFLSLVLHRLPDLGSATYSFLIEYFGSAQAVLKQPLATLEPMLKAATLAAIRDFQQDPEGSAVGRQVMSDLQWLEERRDIHLLGLQDNDYPELLRRIARPPPLLFVRGDITCLSLPQLAIVGSRNPSAGGVENAHRFARHLAAQGFAITSGLALGVDAAAHQGALAAEGKTLAIMGTGIDSVYPTRHLDLAQSIVDSGGALISEFPLGTAARAAHFPQRNRIISGLSLGVLVVEAAIQSGSLITAKAALQQNREVFAIPGSIHNPMARGCHQLIRQGATLVETAQDIVEQLGAMLGYQYQTLLRDDAERQVEASSPLADGPGLDLQERSFAEQQLLDAIGFDLITIDELIQRTGHPVGLLMAQLVNLEIKGLIQPVGEGYQRL